MLRIKKLKIQNLGRFVGSHEIDFELKSNLIQVDAENRNTGGSSGGGKSSLFLAIEYVFGLNDVPATVLQSRLSKNPVSVEIEIAKDNDAYTICRHRTEGLSINGPGITLSGSTKEAEEVLDRILGIPKNLLRPMFYKRQGEGGFFLSKTPKQCHDFLMECLGLNSLESKIDKLNLRLKKIEEDLTVKNSQFSLIESSIATSQEFIDSLSPPKCDVDEATLSFLLEKIEESKKKLTENTQAMSAALSRSGIIPAFSYRDDPKTVDELLKKEEELSEIEEESNFISNKISDISELIQTDKSHVKIFKSSIDKKDTVAKEFEELKLQISEAMKKTCPTCKQKIGQETHAQEILVPLVDKAKRKKSELDSILSMEERLPQVQNAIVQNELLLSELKNKTSENEIAYDKIKAEIFSLTSSREEKRKKALADYKNVVDLINKEKETIADAYSPTIASLEATVEAYNQSYYRGQASLKAYATASAQYEEQKKIAESKLNSLKDSAEKTRESVALLSRELLIAQGSLKFLKSYTNQLFHESLCTVAETATAILAKIPNMATATIVFDSYKETKSGALKEEVVPILSLDEELNVPVRSMSGGERASVDLAIDLAVIDMIEKQTGNGLDLFILDEPFDGLDAVCRENCLEVLKNHAYDRKIIIVDHSSETKQMVQDKILVIREGQTSRISDNI